MNDLFLLARIADRSIAVAGHQVDSVVDIGEVTPVPRAPAVVRGLAALRSRVVTVIDTRIALGLASSDRIKRAVIALLDGHHYAFLVDGVEDVALYPRLAVTAGAFPGRGWGTEAAGLIERDGEPIVVLDLAALLSGQVEPA